MMRAVPHPHRVVKQHQVARALVSVFIRQGEFVVVFYPDETVATSQRGAFVVAFDEVDAAVELVQNTPGFSGARQAEVAQVVNVVVRPDRVVPVLDQHGIHLRNGGEGAPRVLNDVSVAEMGVGGEVGSHWLLDYRGVTWWWAGKVAGAN